MPGIRNNKRIVATDTNYRGDFRPTSIIAEDIPKSLSNSLRRGLTKTEPPNYAIESTYPSASGSPKSALRPPGAQQYTTLVQYHEFDSRCNAIPINVHSAWRRLADTTFSMMYDCHHPRTIFNAFRGHDIGFSGQYPINIRAIWLSHHDYQIYASLYAVGRRLVSRD